MSNEKTERLTVRLTKDQKEKIKIMAIKKGMTISELFLVSMMKYVSENEMMISDDLTSEED